MRVAGQGEVALSLRKAIQCCSDLFGGCSELYGDIAQIKSQCGEHLIVARATEMHAATGCADACSQAFLERGLSIFVGELDAPVAECMRRRKRFEALFDGFAIFGREQSLRMQHLRVRDRGACVVRH